MPGGVLDGVPGQEKDIRSKLLKSEQSGAGFTEVHGRHKHTVGPEGVAIWGGRGDGQTGTLFETLPKIYTYF